MLLYPTIVLINVILKRERQFNDLYALHKSNIITLIIKFINNSIIFCVFSIGALSIILIYKKRSTYIIIISRRQKN